MWYVCVEIWNKEGRRWKYFNTLVSDRALSKVFFFPIGYAIIRQILSFSLFLSFQFPSNSSSQVHIPSLSVDGLSTPVVLSPGPQKP